jgi:hypothetical protein
VKEIAWYLLGFSVVVGFVAFGLLLAPDASDAAEAPGGLFSHLDPRETADLIVGLAFAAIAFVCGSYLSARAAADADDAAPTADLVTAQSVN